ncbi:hypothetical protein GUITHDRAFT_150040 [Guillardia theta CCMP2712]|uniref:Uncharacterized protein n=1 Tax=Guillardia theta (strain CCMP2712) TaxID=905079 RepID=L1K1S6_GUITC|nr:hypothetical protein GUITHDRAFT_150040 [Guillardia theta CCMP2712]EKX54534.1 hypothetical protein GUITHDRAFT_150040 [Guillardia theta CCMP2712]|eukprot:XP_005841514.1 hypothetical protein GUITHDRAFT_150040 [Guillardia theta CCMP2712]
MRAKCILVVVHDHACSSFRHGTAVMVLYGRQLQQYSIATSTSLAALLLCDSFASESKSQLDGSYSRNIMIAIGTS